MRRNDLHQYQRYCCEYIRDHPEAMIFLDCGLGKTVISLTAIVDLMFDRFEISRVLVVAPLRVCNSVWPEERKNWEHTSMLRMSVVTGSAKQREAALRKQADVYVLNRENLPWLVRYLEQNGRAWPFDMVVLDELSSFKNHFSQRWKAFRKIRPQVKRVIGLTGTPAGNGLMDLWAETYMIDRGQRLGKFIGRYRDAFFSPAGMNPYSGVVYSYVPRPGAEEEIYRRIGDITISMKALDYLDMPEYVAVNHLVEMEPKELELYNQMKEYLIIHLKDESIEAANAAVLSGKLLQMANGAIYDAERGVRQLHDRKLDALADLIEEANGQNVLIAYWFRHDMERIMKRFPEARELKSTQDMDDWNDGKIPVALISPASAGHGLNIQRGGHILIWFSLIWSLEMYQQTNARLWRQGQKEVVTIHHIVTRGTVDEDVLSALKRKDTTQQNLINAVKAHLTI